MNPKEYEELVYNYYKKKGYSVKLTNYSNDYGVDVFAQKDNKKIAIQAKMYKEGSRKINRSMVMELCGAMHYFDCTDAKLVTDGEILDDAKEVANKLNIEIIYLDSDVNLKPKLSKNDFFSNIWEKYIIPLNGKILTRENGKTNKILSVDYTGIKRRTSNSKEQFIKIEIFRLVIDYLKENKEITRDYINQNYPGRASSGICLILSQVPLFKLEKSPMRLLYFKE